MDGASCLGGVAALGSVSNKSEWWQRKRPDMRWNSALSKRICVSEKIRMIPLWEYMPVYAKIWEYMPNKNDNEAINDKEVSDVSDVSDVITCL